MKKKQAASMSTETAETKSNVIDMMTSPKMSVATLQRVHTNFETIIRSQIQLMLERGVPEEVLAQIVKDQAAVVKMNERAA